MTLSENSYTPEEDRRLATNLHGLTSSVHRGVHDPFPLRLDLLCGLHRQLFDGVRDHAGQIRTRGFGTEFLTFGPNRSARRDDVPDAILDLFNSASREMRILDGSRNSADYETRAIEFAKWSDVPFGLEHHSSRLGPPPHCLGSRQRGIPQLFELVLHRREPTAFVRPYPSMLSTYGRL